MHIIMGDVAVPPMVGKQISGYEPYLFNMKKRRLLIC